MPRRGDKVSETSPIVEVEKSKPEVKTNQLEALVSYRRKTEQKETISNSDKMKDENAVNREIAALLLNLHASRGAPKIVSPVVPKQEDSAATLNNESAMDLTKSKPTTLNMPLPATITRMVNKDTK